MARKFDRDDLSTTAGRKAMRRALMLGDHGLLRLFYDNTHEVDPGKLWRTYQPSPEKLNAWKDRGIRTVINLRGVTPAAHYLLEEEACLDLGLKLVTFHVYSREAPGRETLHSARNFFSKIEYPAIMHCKSGADRAGLMGVLYRFFVAGDPLDQAMEHLSFKYGHVRHGKTGVIDFAFQRYIDHATTNGIALDDLDAFFEWVDGPYDPIALKQEFLSTWWGRFLTDGLLRRE